MKKYNKVESIRISFAQQAAYGTPYVCTLKPSWYCPDALNGQ